MMSQPDDHLLDILDKVLTSLLFKASFARSMWSRTEILVLTRRPLQELKSIIEAMEGTIQCCLGILKQMQNLQMALLTKTWLLA